MGITNGSSSLLVKRGAYVAICSEVQGNNIVEHMLHMELINEAWHYARATVKVGHFEWITMWARQRENSRQISFT